MTTAVTRLLRFHQGQTVLLPASLRVEGDQVIARRHRLTITQGAIAMVKLGILACVLLTFGDQADAQSLRCGRDFAQIGENKFVIESKCGPPAAKDSFCKPIGIAPSTVGRPPHVACDMVEEWVYKPGIGQFITILQFREGELREMKYGPRQ